LRLPTFPFKEENYMKKVIILAMVATFMIMSLSAPAAFARGAKSGATTVQGTLSQDGSDYVIKSGKTTYIVVGDGLASLVGKKVVASGKMTKTDKGKVLQVEKINEDISKKK
jgi:hypothetical protein